ncbi:hypothetical protein [Mycoplasma anserisalpingitidis]|uniref:hypothetical protein n=1 Tax=Mycoplasma anserisalpingitidis TaxID=519450 RepID=UPI0011B1BF18|nr:hypothetical protein [Mycoplasma anserisalpingitidis]QDY87735.1 hypothetical protein FOY45_02235 [Mycoplasma anserisalpingitidis]
MEKNILLNKIDYSVAYYKFEIANYNAYAEMSEDTIDNYLFENAFDYSNLNQKITVEEIVNQIANDKVPISKKWLYEDILNLVEKMDELLKERSFENFEQLVRTASFENQKDFILDSIYPLIKIHYLTLTKKIIENSIFENIEISWEDLEDLICEKIEEFCDADVLNKYIPNEIPELEEMLNKNKKIENSAELAQ